MRSGRLPRGRRPLFCLLELCGLCRGASSVVRGAHGYDVGGVSMVLLTSPGSFGAVASGRIWPGPMGACADIYLLGGWWTSAERCSIEAERRLAQMGIGLGSSGDSASS